MINSTCFLDGSQGSFDNLFATLIKLSNFSGHKINFLNLMLFGLVLKSKGVSNLFQISVSLGKLKQIEGVLNCWHTRNHSLSSNICVIKTLLLPQLLYLFSVLSIKIPKYVLELDKMFYKFIWNGGNDIFILKTGVKKVY